MPRRSNKVTNWVPNPADIFLKIKKQKKYKLQILTKNACSCFSYKLRGEREQVGDYGFPFTTLASLYNMTKTAEITLDSWQEEFLNYKGDKLLNTGRQVGKTTIMAISAAQRMLAKPNTQIIVVSLTEDQAKLIILMCLDYLQKHYPRKIPKKKDKPTLNRIRLTNKSQILARPVGQTGDAIRGFTGDILIIDEASRMSELIMEAATPTLMTTAGEVWICSTPFGKKGFFYRAWLNADNRYKVWNVTAEEVINSRPITSTWTEEQRVKAIDFLKKEKAEKSEKQYGQEYLGLFLDDLQQYFDDKLIDKTLVLPRLVVKPKTRNVMGVDIARFGEDECAYQILHVTPNNIQHIESITKKKQATTKTEEDILDLNSFYNPLKIGIDAGSGSLGVGIYDHLLKNFKTRRKVIAMNSRAISQSRDDKDKTRIFKEDMYENLLNLMEKGKIKLLNDEKVRLSLKSIQFEFVERQGLTKIQIHGDYDHIVDALVRAAWIAEKEKLNKADFSYIRRL